MITVPVAFASEIARREGLEGDRWVASLPYIVADLLQRWCCTVRGPVLHGKVGIVVPVHRDDRSLAVVKVSFPHPGNVNEPDALATWAGRGAVRMFERDDARFAMLLEQVGQVGQVEHETLVALDDDDAAAEVCGQLTRQLAVPAPPHVRRLSDRAAEEQTQLHDAFDVLADHVSGRVIEAALATVHELGHAQPDTLVHGDLHYRNIIRAAREPWLAIDPKGFAGDPAHDAQSVLIGSFQRQLSADRICAELPRRLAVFAEAAELDGDRVRRWVQEKTVLHAYRAVKSARPDRALELAVRVATILT